MAALRDASRKWLDRFTEQLARFQRPASWILLLGLSALDVSPAPPHRMTPREVRALVFDVLDRSLPAQTVLSIMHHIDAAMTESVKVA